MIKSKLSKGLTSPKTPSRIKTNKQFFTSPKAQTDRGSDNLRETIELLTEEKNLLYEYKSASVPKIQKLIENLDRSEQELQKKEGEIKKLKSFYESEISCMQDYIEILKSSINPKIEEQLKSEKARSMTFYRALTKKQQECESNKESLVKIKQLETHINTLEDQLIKLKKNESERLKENEKLQHNFNHISKDSSSSNKSSNLTEMIRNLKEDVKERMNENTSQVISNFNLFSTKIKKMNEKVQILEEIQNELKMEKDSKVLINELKNEVLALKKEKFELQKTLEKNYKDNISDIKSYEEEIERLKKKIKNLNQENIENKIVLEEKIRKKSFELSSYMEKWKDSEDGKKKLEKEMEKLKDLEASEAVIQMLNEENRKLIETQNSMEKQVKELKNAYMVWIQEKNIIKKEQDLTENIIQDLKDSLSKAQSEISRLSQEKTLSLQEQSSKKESSLSTCDKTKTLTLEKSIIIKIIPSSPNPLISNYSKKLQKLKQVKQELSMLKDSQKKDSQLSDSLIVFSKQEENNIIRQEIDNLRESKKFLQIENEALASEKKSLNTILKTLSSQVDKLNEEKFVLEEDRSRVFKELKLANEIIFHNQKFLDSSESFVIIEPETQDFSKLQRKIDELNEELNLEKRQHEETVFNLIEAERRIENLVINLKNTKDEVLDRESEIDEYRNSLVSVSTNMQDLRVKYQVTLEKYQELLNDSAEKEKVYFNNLSLLQKYEKDIQGQDELLEKRRVLIEELQEVIEDYKQETAKSQEKINKLEVDLQKISKNLTENIELRKKIIDFNSPIKEQFSMDRTITEESSKEFEELDKFKTKSKIQDLLDELCEPIEDLSTEKQKILSQLKTEANLIENQKLDEIRSKIKKLQIKIKELRRKYRLLILNYESTQEENFVLKQKIKNSMSQEDLQRVVELSELDSLSIDCKQLSRIEGNRESLDLIQGLQDENSRLKDEIEKIKESTLGYSTSEGDTYRKPEDTLSDTWTDGEVEKEKPRCLPPVIRKLVNHDENILIMDNNDSSSSRSGISSPDVDISDELLFESK